MSRSNSPVLATGWIDPRVVTHTGSWPEDTLWQMQNSNSVHDEQNLEPSAYPTHPLLPEGVQRQNPYFLNEQNEQPSARTIHEGQSLLEQMGDPSESEDPWSREYVVDETGTRYEVFPPDALNPHHFQHLLPEGVQPQTPYFLNEQHEQPSARTIHEGQSLLPPYYDPYYDPPGSNYFLDETGTRREWDRDAAIRQLEMDQAVRRSFAADAPTNATHSGCPSDLEPDNLMLDHSHPFFSIQTPLPRLFGSEIISGNDDESAFAGLAPMRDPIAPSPTSRPLFAAPGRNTDQLPSDSPLSNAHASITLFPLGELEQPARDNLYKRFEHTRVPGPTGMGNCVDLVTATDSGYHSESRNSRANCGEGNTIDNDTDSVVTDGWPSSLPRQDKYMLEAEFAREIFNRSSAKTREQFIKRGQTVKDLLHSFSAMMWGRATSVAERGVASFVRHGRKYVPSDPDLHLRDCSYVHTLIL
jgi:hypothetical protein